MKEIKRLSFEEAREDPLTREQEGEGQGNAQYGVRFHTWNGT